MRISVILLAGDRTRLEQGQGTAQGGAAPDGERWLRYTLRDLAYWREAGHEVIVVDEARGGPGGAVQTTRAPGYATQVDQYFSATGNYASRLNAGAASANGDVLLFLRAGTRLPAQAAAAILQGLPSSDCGWGRFDVQLLGQRDGLRWAEWLLNRHSRLSGTAMSEQAIFVRRDLFRQVAGFADIPILEDVDLCRRLKAHGAPLCLHERVTVAGQPWERGGLGANIRKVIGLRLAYFLGESPPALYQRFYGRPVTGSAVAQPLFSYPAARILLWAQAPVLGEVKPQLQAQLGRSETLQLYRQLIRFTWSQIQQRELAPAAIWVSEPGCEAFFDELCSPQQQCLQQGSTAGAALLHAAQTALREMGRAALQETGQQAGQNGDEKGEQNAEHEAGQVIIVAADFVSLDAAYLQWALQALDDGVKVVIGPADDGSCGLIGLRAPLVEALFEDIDWGTEHCLAQIRQRLHEAEVQWVELPVRWRLETPEDLKRLSALHDWQQMQHD